MIDINKETLMQSASEASKAGGEGCTLPVVADVTNPSDAEMVVRNTVTELGGLHILVNNAGTNQRNLGFTTALSQHFWEVPPEAWTKV